MTTDDQTLPDAPGVTHRWVDAGGLRMHVAEAGPQDAPPLLLVHGWPQHWWAWRHVIPQVADRYRVIAPDLRGHGWTDAPQGGYDKQTMADDLLALLDALGLDRVTWVGHDWGAFTGYLAAMRAPERFERLIAMSIPPPYTRNRSPATLALLLSYQVPISTPALGTYIVRHGFAGRILRAGRANGKWTGEEMRTYDDVFRARPHVTVGVYRTFLLHELAPLARGQYSKGDLTVPTTAVVGDRDAVARSVTAESFPELDVRRAAGAGHFLMEEAPEAVVAAIG